MCGPGHVQCLAPGSALRLSPHDHRVLADIRTAPPEGPELETLAWTGVEVERELLVSEGTRVEHLSGDVHFLQRLPRGRVVYINGEDPVVVRRYVVKHQPESGAV